MINKTLHSKYGTARINNEGYYWITSRKEGNNGKRLHRLIWEDFYNTEVPKGYVIHHRNFNKLDNCILNLQLMKKGEHIKLHHIGKNVSNNTKMKISESKNNSGYYRVDKHKDKRLNQGFRWRYQYIDNGEWKAIVSVDIKKLEAKVRAKGLKWKKLKGGD